MWIIPKTLSAFVPATPGWSLELSEQAWMFAQSVTWRSKFMSKQYWLKRFKKGDYVQHLSGLTLSPSMHDHFVESWTESQEASHVSHFQAPENEKDKKTQGTYGQASQTLFDFADPDGSSSKTCQDWLPLGCVTSCKTWDKWVTERRGAYSVRKKLARHTKGNESSSWPTARTSDSIGHSQSKIKRVQNGTMPAGKAQLREWVQPSWATPQASDHIEGARTAKESNQKCLGRDLNQMKWATPQSTDGDRINQVRKPSELSEKAKKGGCRNLREDVQNWATPVAMNDGIYVDNSPNKDKRHSQGLATQASQNWPTPRAGNPGSRKPGTGGKILAEEAKIHNGLQDQEKSNTSGKNQGSPKLNPNWVEQLMGLSTGWTDLGSWGMELSPKPQN